MDRILLLLAWVVTALALVGCESGAIDRGPPQKVLCYSGGTIIYSGQSAGHVSQWSNGVYFRDAKTGTKMTIRNADCMIAE